MSAEEDTSNMRTGLMGGTDDGRGTLVCSPEQNQSPDRLVLSLRAENGSGSQSQNLPVFIKGSSPEAEPTSGFLPAEQNQQLGMLSVRCWFHPGGGVYLWIYTGL